MKVLVTGVAGFIGSHLAERLVELGFEVVGIDCFTEYYSKKVKENNIRNIIDSPRFLIIRKNLLDVELKDILDDCDYVFHLAAQAGVRESWGEDFSIYTRNNVLATQKLLEACKDIKIKKFVYASSSSIYGDAPALLMKEDDNLRPISPYGVTKLAGEHLCYVYWKNFAVPTVSLRYFTVYGPRQRPDMAFHKFIKAILEDDAISIYGDGKQTRDFTFISDLVNANILAMKTGHGGEVFNIGGGSNTSVNETIKILEKAIKKEARVRYIEKQRGDVEHTYADISKAERLLGYEPKIGIKKGMREEINWIIASKNNVKVQKIQYEKV